jgi:hypothetical protein
MEGDGVKGPDGGEGKRLFGKGRHPVPQPPRLQKKMLRPSASTMISPGTGEDHSSLDDELAGHSRPVVIGADETIAAALSRDEE